MRVTTAPLVERFCSLEGPTRPPAARAALAAHVPAEHLETVVGFERAYGGRVLRSATGGLTELGVLREGAVAAGNGVIELARAARIGGSHAWMSLADGTVTFSEDFDEEASVACPFAWLNLHAANAAMFLRKRSLSGVGLRGRLRDADFDAVFSQVDGEAIYGDGAAMVFWSERACGQRWRDRVRMYLRTDHDAYDLLIAVGEVGRSLEVFFSGGPFPARESLRPALDGLPCLRSYALEGKGQDGARDLRGRDDEWAIIDSTGEDFALVASSRGRSHGRG